MGLQYRSLENQSVESVGSGLCDRSLQRDSGYSHPGNVFIVVLCILLWWYCRCGNRKISFILACWLFAFYLLAFSLSTLIF